ncbi:MAG: hypothetical protein AAFX39_12600 [Pseudomonadota bacterium]
MTTSILRFNPPSDPSASSFSILFPSNLTLSDDDRTLAPAFSRAFIVRSELPDSAPFLDFDFTTLSSLPAGLTFSRPSSAWDYQFDVYAADAPRLTPSGLLYEEARTNLVTDSQAIESWIAVNTTITANNVTAPDETLTADTVTSSNAGGSGVAMVIQGETLAADTDYVWSSYLRAGLGEWMFLRFGAYDENADAFFNLSTGAVGAVSPAVVSSGFRSVGAGWYRGHLVYQTTNDLVGGVRIHVADSDNDLIVNFDASLSIAVWQMQLEAGAQPSSPIVTNALDGTRAEDKLNIDLADGEWDLLIERADVDGGATASFVDVVAAGGIGYDVPIDMARPYLHRIRVWPEGFLTAAQKDYLLT